MGTFWTTHRCQRMSDSVSSRWERSMRRSILRLLSQTKQRLSHLEEDITNNLSTISVQEMSLTLADRENHYRSALMHCEEQLNRYSEGMRILHKDWRTCVQEASPSKRWIRLIPSPSSSERLYNQSWIVSGRCRRWRRVQGRHYHRRVRVSS